MKLFFFCGLLALIACGTDQKQQSDLDSEVNTTADTTIQEAINYTDDSGLKQGYWITFGKDFPEKGYPNDGKIDEGNYIDNIKSGEWYYYRNPGLEVDSVVTYDYGKVISVDIK